MKKRVFIGLLFVCCVAGFSAEEKEKEEMQPEHMNMLSDLFTSGKQTNLTPHLTVFDDNGNLIELLLEEIEDTLELSHDDLEKRIYYYLYTQKNPVNPQLLYTGDDDILKQSNFDPTKPTRFVTHGWMNSFKSEACTLIRDAFLKHGDHNVIVIDWSSISYRPYLWSSNQVKNIGPLVSRMLDYLGTHGMDFSQTIMVGHSLGAHVVGIAAYFANNTINYVVGLDPALPNFITAGPKERISVDDANYVEIIHTNAGLLGYLLPIGHIDFYPNGGTRQPGCLLDAGGSCSHSRSVKFFAESINSPVGFVATHCESYVRYRMGKCKDNERYIMGGVKIKKEMKGSFYLSTRAASPYAKG